MSTTKIPSAVVVTCDACHAVCGRGDGEKSRLMGTVLKIERAALDMYNMPVADASLALDLCDCCALEITTTINKRAEALLAAARAHEGDPCRFCGAAHDDVPIGPCAARLA